MFIILIFALIGFFVYYQYSQKKNALLSLPPGPKPLPIVGNILDLPPPGVTEFEHWFKHKALYGPISSITVFGQTMVIIHDKQAAYDIMEKMSLKTSGRPKTVFAHELCGFEKFTSGRQYDTTFRLHRKLMHQHSGTKLYSARLNDVQDVESLHLLQRALDDSKNLLQHFKTEAAAIILKIVYGYTIDPHGVDPLVALIETMMGNFSKAIVGASSEPVDMIPALKYLPDWFPGATFKKTAREWNKINHDAVNIPYSFVEQQMTDGNHHPSFVSQLIERYGSDKSKDGRLDSETEDATKWAAGILYGGGADTTAASMSAFTLAMVLFPEAQKKAQAEIDNIIGTSPNRLPTFEDRERLPYTSALVTEVIRWYTIVPITTTHMTDQEIVYGGYRIPKGSYLLPSIWWFHHDPQTYPDPFQFSPERFLPPRNEPDPNEAFGWGRRICPGRYIAHDNLFINIARLLAAFNISKQVDEQGMPMNPKVEYMPGLISRLTDFPFNIAARSEAHEALVRSIEVDHPWQNGDADFVEFGDQPQVATEV